ncbi:MAG: 30S ribosomal protein S8 [bacterium]
MSKSFDPIADMLTKIRNGQRASHLQVDIPSSGIKIQIARILKDEGYIKGWKVIEDKLQGILRIFLRYSEDKEPMITGIKRISKPGRRIYVGCKNIPKVLGGKGRVILTTPYGVMTDREAKKRLLGGEVICYIW